MTTDPDHQSAADRNTGVDAALRALEASTVRLIQTVADLAERVNTTQEMQSSLATTMQSQASQHRTNRWLTTSMAFNVLLSFGFGFGLYRIDKNAQAIADIQSRTSNSVLCPLYSVFLASIESAPPAAADTDRDGEVSAAEQARFDRAARVIRDGYDELACKPSAKK